LLAFLLALLTACNQVHATIKFNLFTCQPFRALFQQEAFKGRTDDQRPILIQKSRTGHLRHGTGGQFRHMASVCRICEVPQKPLPTIPLPV